MIVSAVSQVADVGALLSRELAARLEVVDILSRKMLSGRMQGERRSKRRGRSVEFDDYRQYLPGDDPRHLDWNVLARLDKLVIKLFQEEEDLCLDVLVDCSASMHSADVMPALGAPQTARATSKLLFAAQLACALGAIGLSNNNRVSVTLFGAKFGGATGSPVVSSVARPLVRLQPLRGRGSTSRLVGFVRDFAFVPPSAAGAGGAEAMDMAVRAILGGARGGRGVLVVISDFLMPAGGEGVAGYTQVLRALGAAAGGGGGSAGRMGIDPYLLVVHTPQERDVAALARPGGLLAGDVRLTDVESGRAAEVTMGEAAVRGYQQRSAEHWKQLSSASSRAGVSLVTLPTDLDPASVVLGLLRARGLLG